MKQYTDDTVISLSNFNCYDMKFKLKEIKSIVNPCAAKLQSRNDEGFI